ncbi:sensor histidine kinase [Leifsonia sp. NPDC102414]|uniref:sensor histidine kinase n=1 Tax=Leifsonia sp. NPDC102414 TaxID=3364124 RepID=UPI00382D6A84
MVKLFPVAQRSIEPVIAIAFFLFWAFAEVGRHQLVAGTLRYTLPWWAALLGLSFAIAICRIWPMIAMGVSIVVAVGQLLVPAAAFGAGYGSTDWPMAVGFLLVVIGVSAFIPSRWRALSFAFAIALAVSTPFAGGPITLDSLFVLATSLLAFVCAWLLGFFGRAWQQKLRSEALLAQTTDELRSAEVDLLVSQERDRIAQDVHDIMAHSLSVIIAQADGARFVAPARPEAVSESLENIAASARTSLTEVRMLIQTLVADPIGHSTPTVDDVGELVERMRTAGLAVELKQFGDADPLTGAQELAVYRIVQESLTNALKHAGTEPSARVSLDWRGQGLAIAVTSSGTPGERETQTTKSRGLYGMHERARLAGGWLTAGVDDDVPGGYVVTAFIPTAAVGQAS